LFSTLRELTARALPGEAMAALILLAIAVPERLATARLMGLPPITGLLAFAAGTLAFAAFGLSRTVSVGADSTIASIMAAALAPRVICGKTMNGDTTGGRGQPLPSMQAAPPRLERLQHRRAVMLMSTALTVAASVPALLGDYVYDDERMVDNPAMNEVTDLWAVPYRTSAAYLSDDPASATAGGNTWRPTAMIGLVAVQVLAPSPALHHLVSLALHLMTVWLLFLAMPRPNEVWALLVALFALHSALGEAWLWINGRADLTAGLCLAALFALGARLPARHTILGFAALALGFLGTGAKETFVPGAAILSLSLAWGGPLLARVGTASSAAQRDMQGARVIAAGAALGMGLALALRATVVVGGSGATRLLSISTIARIPALIGLGVETLLLPYPRPMRSLSYALEVGTGLHLLFAAALVAMLALLLRRRRYRSVLLLLGAVAILAPTALVADVYWLGFDRYLYPSAVLVLVSIATTQAAQFVMPRWARWMALGLVVALALAVAVTGTYFANPASFSEARAARYPGDPAVILERAATLARAGHTDDALSAMETLPADLPPATAHVAATYLHRLGRSDLVVLLLEDVYRRYPEHPFVRYDMVELRAAQGRFDEALTLARGLQDDPAFCQTIAQLLDSWLGSRRLPPDVALRVRRLRTEGECGHRGGTER